MSLSHTRIAQTLWRNRPSMKPQLWEDFHLALKRRLEFEARRRLDPAWLDRPVTVQLSKIGFEDGRGTIRLRIRPRDVTNKAMFLYGVFEISETRLIQALLRPGMMFIDVGANIGYYAAIAAHLVGKSGSVHTFEPNGRVRAMLEENVRLNDLDNVVVHPEAVSTTSGTVAFYESSWSANQGVSSMFPGDALTRVTNVPATTLDDLAATLGGRSIDVVKMDIEGAEPLAIEGGRQLFSGPTAPHLIFEAADLEKVQPLVRSFGYHVRRIEYSLEEGLLLVAPESDTRSLFAEYEAPNYFAAKHPAVFDEALTRARGRRPPLMRLLGRF